MSDATRAVSETTPRRPAHPRRAVRPGRHERAQRPLLHDQGPGAAADPPRPLGLLLPRPRRPPRARPGAAEPRLHAVGDRAVPRRHPGRRHPRGHRAGPHHAGALGRRAADRDEPRASCRAARAASCVDDDLRTLQALGVVFPLDRGAGEHGRSRVSQLSVGLGLLELGFPVEAAQAAADVFARHGREMSPGALRQLPHHGVAGLHEQGHTAETVQQVVEKIKPLSIASPGLGLRGGHGRDPSRADRQALRSRARVDRTCR